MFLRKILFTYFITLLFNLFLLKVYKKLSLKVLLLRGRCWPPELGSPWQAYLCVVSQENTGHPTLQNPVK